MRYYELTCLGETNTVQSIVVPLVEKEGGLMADVYKKTNLASFYFQIEPENLDNLEKKLKSEKEISHFIILAKKAKGSTHKRAAFAEEPKRKVEIGEIEQKLEEILGE